jgi:outer membrane protein insertion porin family
MGRSHVIAACRTVVMLAILVASATANASPEPAVVLTGNTVFTTAQVRAGTAPHEVSLVDANGDIDDEAVARQALLISAFYWDRGHVQVNIGEPVIDRVNHRVDIAVAEGAKFTIGAVRITGKRVQTERHHLAMIRVRPGDVFSRSKIADDREKLSLFYEDRGYAYANVLPLTKVDLKARTIGLTFEIDPGAVSFVEAIDVYGNTRTSAATIRNAMQIAPNDTWHGTRLRESKRLLEQLGYFTKVVISTRRGSTPSSVLVLVEVTE